MTTDQAVQCLNDGIGGMQSVIAKHTKRLRERSPPPVTANGDAKFNSILKNSEEISVTDLDAKQKRALLRSSWQLKNLESGFTPWEFTGSTVVMFDNAFDPQ